MHLRSLAAVLLVLLSSAPLAAQEETIPEVTPTLDVAGAASAPLAVRRPPEHPVPAPFDEGARVRVTLRAEDFPRVTGEFVQMDWRSLVISGEETGPLSRSWSSVRLLEVSRGRTRGGAAWKGATLGAFVGMGLGIISGALVSRYLPTETEASILLGGMGVGLVGSGIGAGVGAVVAPERWHPVIRGGIPGPPSPLP